VLTPFTLTGAFSPKECDRIIDLARSRPLDEAGLVKNVADPAIRRAELAWLDERPGAEWVMDRIVETVARANREVFDFALTDFAESAQVARYGAEREGHFGWHSDIGAGAVAERRKLTMVVQLSEPSDYEGGFLEVWPDGNVRQSETARGAATIFPSFHLHRVTPVTAGERWSLTVWAHGPAFR
jgi:PKHD-type hydroxylase